MSKWLLSSTYTDTFVKIKLEFLSYLYGKQLHQRNAVEIIVTS